MAVRRRLLNNNSLPSVDANTGDNSSSFNQIQQNVSQNANGDAQSHKILELIRKFSGLDSVTQLSPEAEKFLSVLDKRINDSALGDREAGHIEVLRLQTLRHSRAVISGNRAVVLILAEANLVSDNLPTVILESKARDELTRLHPHIQILMNIVITPYDYAIAESFIKFIRRVLPDETKIHERWVRLLSDNILSLSDNLSDYESAYSTISPHAVPLRADLHLTVYSSPKSQTGLRNNQTEGDMGYYKNAGTEAGREPLGAVGGYVEFIKERPNVSRYLPVVHISEISSSIADASLIPFLLRLAMKKFITERRWLDLYISQWPGAYNNPINICNLYKDEGWPRKITNTDDLDNIAARYFDHVQLVLDVTDGRAAIPDLFKFASSDARDVDSILKLYSNVSGEQTDMTRLNPFQKICTFYRGCYSFKRRISDSAKIDFLNEYGIDGNDESDCRRLLIQKTAVDRVMAERKFAQDLKLYYRTDVIGLNPYLLDTLDANEKMINWQY